MSDPETVHIADGPVAPAASATRHVPDGPLPIPAQGASELPRFGRFQAIAELGAGGMGAVYRANDDVLGRAVAIKALHPQADPGIRERFLREAKAVGAILHPNILAIYDAGTDGATPYLVMELASSGSLRERMLSGPLAVDTVRAVGIQIARALAAAHAANIVHRDVKPANILATADSWKLADFGIARLPDSTLTVTGQFLGSPSYAAPESLRAGEFSPASDVYSLGATHYEALTGAPPHGDHELTSLVRKLDKDPPPVSAYRDVPGPLGGAVMAALARDPLRRPSAQQFATMLAAIEHPRPRSRSLPLLAALMAVAALVMLVHAVRLRSARAQSSATPAPSHVAKPVERAPKAKRRTAPPPKPEARPAPSPPAAPDPWAPRAFDDSGNALDENGNPVDQEAARNMLEQMERDARKEYERLGPGRARSKRHRDER